MPTLGSSGGAHLEMGTGAVLSYRLIPAVDRNPFNDPIAGPNTILVRFRTGVNRVAAERSLDKIAQATTNTANFGVTVTGVLRPAEIVNYRFLGTTPVYLGAGLAAGAIAALMLTLIASVRRRRRDLALLKTLGFTQRPACSDGGMAVDRCCGNRCCCRSAGRNRPWPLVVGSVCRRDPRCATAEHSRRIDRPHRPHRPRRARSRQHRRCLPRSRRRAHADGFAPASGMNALA